MGDGTARVEEPEVAVAVVVVAVAVAVAVAVGGIAATRPVGRVGHRPSRGRRVDGVRSEES